MIEAICAGNAVVDLIFSLDTYPVENQKYLVDRSGESVGGPACNAACLLARWGRAVALVAYTGNDAFGTFLLAELGADGVDTSLMAFDAFHPTPISMVMTNTANGSRTIITRVPAGATVSLDGERLDRCAPSSAVRLLLVDGHQAQASLDLILRYPDARVVLDGGTLREGTERLLRESDYAIVSERFALALLKRQDCARAWDLGRASDQRAALQALWHASGGFVAVTLGERGTVFREAETESFGLVPALAVETVDTTGAGDIFHGAFASVILSGGDVHEALRWATAAAGLSVTKSGGHSSIPGIDETAEALREHPVEILPL